MRWRPGGRSRPGGRRPLVPPGAVGDGGRADGGAVRVRSVGRRLRGGLRRSRGRPALRRGRLRLRGDLGPRRRVRLLRLQGRGQVPRPRRPRRPPRGRRRGRERGLPIIAYCVVQQGGRYLAEHPEFAMRGADGKVVPGRFCLNSGYLETLKAPTSEMLAYGIDGFHVDMLDQGFGPPYGCWCETCRKLFQARFNAEPPAGATWDAGWDDMLEFRYDSSRNFERALYEHVKRVKPKRRSISTTTAILPSRSRSARGPWARRQRRLPHRRDRGLGLQRPGGRPERRVLPGRHARPAVPGRHPARGSDVPRPDDPTLERHPMGAGDAAGPRGVRHDGRQDRLRRPARSGRLSTHRRGLPRRQGRPCAPGRKAGPGRGRLLLVPEPRLVRPRAAEPLLPGVPGAHRALVLEHVPWGVALDENATAETLERSRS